jgi:hypothetical protein
VALAGVALTAAVFAMDCAPLAWGFVGLTVAILLATIGNRLPILHAWPVMGAPNVSAALKLDGRSDLRVGVRRHQPIPVPENLKDVVGEGGPAPEPRNARLEVGIAHTKRGSIRDAAVTLMLPEGIRHAETDPYGHQTENGKWMPPTGESLRTDDDGNPVWSDYWVWRGDLPSGSLLFYFTLTVSAFGDVPVRIKVEAPELYEEFKSDHMLRLTEIKRDEEPHVDRLAYAIQDAEDARDTLQRPDATTDRVSVVYYSLLEALPDDREDLAQVIRGRPVIFKGPEAGPAYEVALIDTKLRAAYDVRRRLAESG